MVHAIRSRFPARSSASGRYAARRRGGSLIALSVGAIRGWLETFIQRAMQVLRARCLFLYLTSGQLAITNLLIKNDLCNR